MTFTLTFNGKSIRIENSDALKPDYDFPLNLTAIKFDEPASAIEFSSMGKDNRVYIDLASISSPTLADYAALKALVTTWQSSAFANVGGKTSKKIDSFVTAAGATAYTAGDVVNATGAASLRSIDVGCNSGYITDIAIEMEVAANLATPATLPQLRLRLYDSSDATLLKADNDADEIVFANNVRRLGYVDMPVMVADVVGGVGRIHCQVSDLRKAFSNLTSNLLYYKLIVLNAPTLGNASPSLGRTVVTRIIVEQN